MQALSRACPPRCVRSADGRAVEQRGRLVRQALKIPKNAERDRLRGFCKPRADRPRSRKGRAWRSTASPCRRADASWALAWRCRHRRDASHADPPASHDAGAKPRAPALQPHADARRQPSRTGARGTRRHRQAPAPRRARARKTDRAGRQTTPLWRAPASSSERTWRQANAVSRFRQGSDKALRGAAPSHLHAQYRGNVA